MYTILLKIFIRDLVVNISPLSIKSVVGQRLEEQSKNDVVKHNDQDFLVN